MHTALDGLTRSLHLVSRQTSLRISHHRCRTALRALSPASMHTNAPSKVKLALCQLPVGRDKDANLRQAAAAIQDAAQQGAKLVVLPEMWSCPYRNDAFPEYAEPLGKDGRAGPAGRLMAEAAKQHGVTLVGGSIPELADGKLYNTCCVYGPDGSLLAAHRKVHLFDIDIPGKITFRESDTLTAGNALTLVHTPAGCLGIGICYDVRFAEMAMVYASLGAQMLIYPGAFNRVTGPAHWELLLRARAVDNQLYVAGCGPACVPESGFEAWGHSTIVGPFAEVVAAAEDGPAVVVAQVDYAQVETRRANIPVRVQKRFDLYRAVEMCS